MHTEAPSVMTVWPGQPYPLGATGTARASILRCSRKTLNKWSCVCSMPRVSARSHKSRCGSAPAAFGRAICRKRGLACYTAIASTVCTGPVPGYRFNVYKLLLGPYSRNMVGPLHWSDAQFSYRLGHRQDDFSFNTRKGAPGMPKCQVVDHAFSWGRIPATPHPHDTVIYELHVRGFTQRHPEIPPQMRGTYAGLACGPVIDYLQALG